LQIEASLGQKQGQIPPDSSAKNHLPISGQLRREASRGQPSARCRRPSSSGSCWASGSLSQLLNNCRSLSADPTPRLLSSLEIHHKAGSSSPCFNQTGLLPLPGASAAPLQGDVARFSSKSMEPASPVNRRASSIWLGQRRDTLLRKFTQLFTEVSS
jgi:hypothetical protein